VNEYRFFLQLEESLEDNLRMLDELGGTRTHNLYPAGWAQAGNTPFRLYKKFNYDGGIRTPMIISDPRLSEHAGGIRHQFQHLIDVVPTLLERLGVAPREQYDGVA